MGRVGHPVLQEGLKQASLGGARIDRASIHFVMLLGGGKPTSGRTKEHMKTLASWTAFQTSTALSAIPARVHSISRAVKTVSLGLARALQSTTSM